MSPAQHRTSRSHDGAPRTSPRRPYGTLVSIAGGLALVCAAVSGCSSGDGARAESSPTYTVRSDDSPAEEGSAGGSGQKAERGTPAGAAAPVHVAVPSIGVSSSLMRLGLNADRTVEVPPPDKGMTAGWYTGGAVPGQRGAAVIIGHNDTRHGKAVFHDLKKVRAGADIAVRDARGRTTHFEVTRTETVSKKAFPTDRVYGATNSRALRLITCDGAFDAQGHPVDNLIVYATANR
ncbi:MULTISPECIES: class F sortase [Streptomyces]|uniref:Peptidase C60 n=1 Tax=Streptomyces alboflavus TaxID=67267 RepID=A0A1Z1W5Q8_9ACTN|nr:class F sortase [Streptomyces alboflavus]ARX81768.1 peptidase C60 [Streptomyces alboflavus]